MLTCPCDIATLSPWSFQFFFPCMHILYIHYILLSSRDKGHSSYKDVAMLDAAFATEMALTILYDFCTCNCQFRAYPNSPLRQEVSSLGTQAHLLSSYSDSKMSYPGLDISACQTSTLEAPCDYFSFHWWQFGSVTIKVQPSLSNVGSFIVIHGDYESLPAPHNLHDFIEYYYAGQGL